MNGAFDDTLDYWFLSVPAGVSALVSTFLVPFLQQRYAAISAATSTSAHADKTNASLLVLAAIFAGFVVVEVLNIAGTFVLLRTWHARAKGVRSLRIALAELRGSFVRCVWTYFLWFLVYFGYLFVVFVLIETAVVVIAIGDKLPLAVVVVAVAAAVAGALYLAWRLVRILVATVYMSVVIASTDLGGRRAIREAVIAVKHRFFLAVGLLLFTSAPVLFLSLMPAQDWRLHMFITAVIGGFLGSFGALVTLGVYMSPKRACLDEPQPERAPVPVLVRS